MLTGQVGTRRARLLQDRVHLAIKATLAASLAYAIARYGVGHPSPSLAPLAALIVIHPTVLSGIRESLQYLGGVLLGIGTGIAAALAVGPNTYGIAFVVLLSLLLGSWGKLGQQGIEVPFLGIFVLLFGGNDILAYVPPRLVDVAIGLPVGVLLNVLVFPPLHLRPASYTLQRLREDITSLIDDIADGIDADWPPSNPDWIHRSLQLEPVIDRARGSVNRAFESVRWNPRAAGGRYETPRRAEAALNGLEHITVSVRGIARTASEAATGGDVPVSLEEGFRRQYAALLRMVRDMVEEYGTPERQVPESSTIADTHDALLRLQDEVARREHGRRTAWFAEGHLLVDLDRIVRDLADARDTAGTAGSAGSWHPDSGEESTEEAGARSRQEIDLRHAYLWRDR